MRLHVVQRAEALCAGGLGRVRGDAVAAGEAGVSPASVAGWRRRVQNLAEGKCLSALIDRPRAGRPHAGMWSGNGADELWALWLSDWLREEAPDGAAVHRRLAAMAGEHGWDLPPLRAFLARTQREVPRGVLVRAREGRLAAMDLTPAQTRTVSGLAPLDIINGDGRRHDVLVTFPSGREGRPVVWVWQDVRTRRVLAWRAGETESADLVRLSLHDVIRNHGVPRKVLVDSTRAASAKWAAGGQPGRRRWKSTGEELPGLLALLEIGYGVTAIDRDAAGRGKGRGRAKPVERAFGDLARQIDSHPRLAGAATGRSPDHRPETHRMRAAAWDDFLAVVAAAIAEHNARPGRRTEAAAGRSFDEVWAEEIGAAVVRRLSAAQAAILLLAAEETRIGRDGTVRLKTGRVAGLPDSRWHHADLVERAGERVVARFDPGALHAPIHLYDRDGRYIVAAPCLAPVGFDDADKARAWSRARRQAIRAADAGLASRRDMDALAAAMRALPAAPEPPAPEPAAIGLVTARAAPQPVPARRSTPYLTALRSITEED